MSGDIDPSPAIVAVISSLGAGGAEKVLAGLARAWTAAGFRVTIVAFDRPGEPVYHDFPPAARIERLGCSEGGVRSTLRRLVRLRRVVRREQPSIVVSFLTKINIVTLLATIGLPVPIAISERNNPEKQKKHPLWNFLLAYAYRRASLIVCQTQGVVRCIPPGLHDRVVVIPNAIERYPFRPALRSRRIAAVGRLTGQKGFDLLIAAYQRVRETHPDWLLEIWGEGPDRGALEEQVRRAGLDDCVRLPGITPKPGQWIERASIFVLSSRFEGFSNVLGEAMAAGLPVVSFDCDFGPSELVRNGTNGMLVPNEDCAALSEALGQLMDDPALRRRISEEAKLVGQRFSAEAIVGEWDRCLALVQRQALRRPVSLAGAIAWLKTMVERFRGQASPGARRLGEISGLPLQPAEISRARSRREPLA
jgi:glycosyltransferase involved in cell wall biosynthesis